MAGNKPATNTRRLAKAINEHVAQAEHHWEQAVQHAIAAGNLLIEVKQSLPHGEFTPWLKANFSREPTTARDYMRLARHAEQLEGAPSISTALKLLAPPKPATTTEPEDSDSDLALYMEQWEREHPEPTRDPEQPPTGHLDEAIHMLDHIDWLLDKQEALSRWVLARAAEFVADPDPDGALLVAYAAASVRQAVTERAWNHATDDDDFDRLTAEAADAYHAYEGARAAFKVALDD
jgi:hypothetical protein